MAQLLGTEAPRTSGPQRRAPRAPNPPPRRAHAPDFSALVFSLPTGGRTYDRIPHDHEVEQLRVTGYTEDTDTNVLPSLAEGGEPKHVPWDRVFVLGEGARQVAIARIDVEPIGTPLGPTWVDHFGLVVDLEVTGRTGLGPWCS